MTHAGPLGTASEETVARRPRFHTLGLTLTAVGIFLVAVNGLILFGGAAALTELSSAAQYGHRSPFAHAVSSLMSVSVLTLTLLFATSFVILGEQLRRGGIGRSSRKQSTLLPQGSYVSSFTPLSVRWHALWAMTTLALSLVLILVPTIGAVRRTWPTTVGGSYAFATSWQTDGIVVLALAAAALVSLFKKVRYLERVRSGRTELPNGRLRSAAWRWLTFRWRLDLWVAGIGGLLIGLSSLAITSTSWDVPDPALADNLSGGAFICAIGLVFELVALWMASNYWKAGEPMGAGESFS